MRRTPAGPGTILVLLEPLYEGGLDDVTLGSSCIANAYTSDHDVIADKETGAMRRLDARGAASTVSPEAPLYGAPR